MHDRPGPHRGLPAGLARRIANLERTLREAPCELLVEELTSGALDVGLLALPALPARSATRRLYRDSSVVACPRAHRFDAMNAVPLRERESAG